MTPAELLELVLGGGSPTVDDLDTFVRVCSKEGRFHDFKHGRVAAKPERQALAVDVRRWASGFANAEGGLLLFGITEPDAGGTRRVSGCESFGAEPFVSWLGKLLESIAVRCALPPRILSVPHPGGEIVLLGIDRALQLIDLVEEHERRYYLRVEDETILAPPYLVTDLILGRRQHPVFDVHLEKLVFREGSTPLRSESWSGTHFRFEPELTLRIENRSLLEVEALRIGTVGWCWTTGQPVHVNEQLVSYLDAEGTPAGHVSGTWQLANFPHLFQHTYPTIELAPFDVKTVPDVLVPYIRPDSDYELSFAIYAISRGSAPQWWHVRTSVAGGYRGTGVPLHPTVPPVISRATGRRVPVGWWKR